MEVVGGWRKMTATSGISYRLILQHETEEKKPVRTECLAFQVYTHTEVLRIRPDLLDFDQDPNKRNPNFEFDRKL